MSVCICGCVLAHECLCLRRCGWREWERGILACCDLSCSDSDSSQGPCGLPAVQHDTATNCLHTHTHMHTHPLPVQCIHAGSRMQKEGKKLWKLKKKQAKKGRWQMKKIKDQRRQKHQINRKREAHRFQRGSIVWSVLQWCCGAGGVAEYFLETRSLFLPLSLSDPAFFFLSKPSSNHIFLGWGKAGKWDQALFDCGRTHIQIRMPVDIWIAAMSNMTANGWSTLRGESSWGVSNMYSSALLSSSSPC